MQVSGFFKCTQCGKLHQISGVRRDSECACGSDLFQQLRDRWTARNRQEKSP